MPSIKRSLTFKRSLPSIKRGREYGVVDHDISAPRLERRRPGGRSEAGQAEAGRAETGRAETRQTKSSESRKAKISPKTLTRVWTIM
ncbi:hypothetical protein GCM10010974_09690 [Brevibacterium sediminis]|uniref:Uncharacterized protein n=1 Tax=Brevibacterium sediminis TaxID=1857024 RepID=A0ABQ1LT17_9MICO|nr:hypothetical protein GCM10010974_09690 [Brevibacterium sediminis]